MRPIDNQDHCPDCRLPSSPPPAFGSTLPTSPHRPRSEELWASPQRLRYLRSLAPETLLGPPAETGLCCASVKVIHEPTSSGFLTETAAPVHPDSSAASGPGPGHGSQDVPLGHGKLHKASNFLQGFRRIVHSFHFF